MKHYPSNITDSQWMLLQGILIDNRKRKHSLRDIFNAIFYLVKTGCQWRMLPGGFPKWESVYYYFTKWKNTGVIEQMHELLRDKIRKKAGREISPSLALLIASLLKRLDWVVKAEVSTGVKRSKAANAILLLIPWVCSLL